MSDAPRTEDGWLDLGVLNAPVKNWIQRYWNDDYLGAMMDHFGPSDAPYRVRLCSSEGNVEVGRFADESEARALYEDLRKRCRLAGEGSI